MKRYLPSTVGSEHITLSVDTAGYFPLNLRKKKGWMRTKWIIVEYTQSEKTPDILFEDVVIECNYPNDKRGQSKRNRRIGYYTVVGVSTELLDWMVNEIKNLTGRYVSYDYISRNEKLTWLDVGDCQAKDEPCYVYKPNLDNTVSIGTLVQVCKRLQSNLVGYGQFHIYVRNDDKLEFFLTGFQMIDTTILQSVPKPEIIKKELSLRTQEALRDMPLE